jgi:hypothetical protein
MSLPGLPSLSGFSSSTSGTFCDHGKIARMAANMYQIEEGALALLLVPDALMPSQYFEGGQRDDPATAAIKRLMLAVLEDALRCLQTYADARTPVRRRMFFEAQTWIADRTGCGPFAFEAICEALGIEHRRLRDGIRQWRLQLSNGMSSHRLRRRSIGRRVGPNSSPIR